MIRTAISGGGTPDGGELIRLLCMHPEVELCAVTESGLEGIPLSAHHHGLIGETTLCFTSEINYDDVDVVFVCSDEMSNAEIMKLRSDRPDLKLILLHSHQGLDRDAGGIVYGLPEINRKLLVRGATAAEVPESFATMALVALFPFAFHLLLNGKIDINVQAPASVVETTDLSEALREITNVLTTVQQSYNGKVDIKAEAGKTRRSALMEISFDSRLDLEQVLKLYEMYDDHNFTFVTLQDIGVSEVAGTNKCIISVDRTQDGRLKLTVAADCRLRGAAGEAVHVMNLLFGLHEKTGLALKAGDFEPIG